MQSETEDDVSKGKPAPIDRLGFFVVSGLFARRVNPVGESDAPHPALAAVIE